MTDKYDAEKIHNWVTGRKKLTQNNFHRLDQGDASAAKPVSEGTDALNNVTTKEGTDEELDPNST